MGYLDRLRIVAAQERAAADVQELQKAPSYSFCNTQSEHARTSKVTGDLAHRGWLLRLPRGAMREMYFPAPVTSVVALAEFPEAVAAEPIPDRQILIPTEAEVAELRTLVEVVYARDTEADRAEALAAALNDPAGALPCYRAIFAAMQSCRRHLVGQSDPQQRDGVNLT